MIGLLLLLTGTCQAAIGFKHFGSFNTDCDAELSFLRGTEFEASVGAGRFLYQFKHSLTEVLKARIALEGCTLTTEQQNLFFGFDALNLVRLLDSSDVKLNTSNFPCTASLFNFNWQKLKADFGGIVLPSSCRALDFETSKTCRMKFKLLPEFFVEFELKDTCTDPAQTGYGLPSISLACSGTQCKNFGVPCAPGGAACGGGLTCDTLADTNLANALSPLIELQLFDNITDHANCDAGGSFQEKFWSAVINTGAKMIGLTDTVATTPYQTVSLCGVQSFQTKFIPTDSPTPSPLWRCQDPADTKILSSKVCDGNNDCPVGGGGVYEDEKFCGSTFATCGSDTMLDNSGNFCCPACFSWNNGGVSPSCNNYHCDYSTQTSGNGPTFCNFDASPVDCPDLMASTGTSLPAQQSMSFATAQGGANQHIAGWADCDGNIQIGNPSEMGVVNARLPFRKITAAVESILTSQLGCRGTISAVNLKRYFSPWSVSFWGGLFFDNQQTANLLNNVNPGAKLDDEIRYYSDASTRNCSVPYSDGQGNTYCCNCEYIAQPPFSNVAGAPTSCSLGSTTGTGSSCELALDISSWFGGGTFPAGWSSNPTIIKIKAASDCAGSSALPQMLVTCEGPCTATSKSGCCILQAAFVGQSGTGSCPAGYKLQAINSGITDFLFPASSTHSQDSTLANFISLISTRTISFGATTTPFIQPDFSTLTRSICVIDGNGFDNNTRDWADATLTDHCPYPPAPSDLRRSCPQFLTTGKITGCTTACLTAPVATPCAATGCPLPPTSITTLADSPCSILSPALGLLAGLAFLFY